MHESDEPPSAPKRARDAHGGGQEHPVRGPHKDARRGPHGHAHGSAGPAQVDTFIVTCSDSRDASTDETGPLIRGMLERAGHRVVGYQRVPDEAVGIAAGLDWAEAAGARALIFNGGTGIGPRDVTVEVLRRLLDKELPGFGELFRALSFQEVGSAAMLSRALAGTCRELVIFAVPGAPAAARLALEALILPELSHLVSELDRGRVTPG